MPKLEHGLIPASVIGLLLLGATPATAQQQQIATVAVPEPTHIIYPAGGQTPEQQQIDHAECKTWATQQTGFDPQRAPAPPNAQTQQGGAVRGGARGALIGAAVGAIAGDVGKGAAIGAASGGLMGGMKQNERNRQTQSAQQQWEQQVGQMLGNWDKAVVTCLTGRGYTVS